MSFSKKKLLKYSVKIQSYMALPRRVPLHLTRHLKSHTAHWQLSREEKSQYYIYIIIVNRKKGGITYLSCDTNREQDRCLCV